MSTRLILIRHGETDWSLKKRYCSFTDVNLNENGMEQARLLSEKLSREKVYKVYSSDMKRCLQFTRILFEDLPIGIMPELREMNFGVFEGLTHEEITKKYPEIYKRWLANPFDVVIPEGESLTFFKKRIEKILAQFISFNKDKTFAVVTHAGPIKIIMGNILMKKDIWEINPVPAGVNIIDLEEGVRAVRLFNDGGYVNG